MSKSKIMKKLAKMSKSKIMKKLAKKRGWKIIDIKMAKMKPEDLRGLVWAKPDFTPSKGGILFFDEMGRFGCDRNNPCSDCDCIYGAV